MTQLCDMFPATPSEQDAAQPGAPDLSTAMLAALYLVVQASGEYAFAWCLHLANPAKLLYHCLMEFTADYNQKLVEILRWRRDVRHFRRDPIAAETMSAIEASVDLAPSVGNSRPWRIIRVSSPANREAVIHCYKKAKEEAGQIYKGEERRAYDALKLAALKDAPVHLAFFTETAPAEGRGLGRQTMPETLSYSTVTAIHTLWLIARTHNVGVGWVSIVDPNRIGEILQTPDSWKLTGYLCLGYPEHDETLPELHRRHWQANTGTVWIDR